MNFGFIGSPVITMFHQVIYGEIVTITLKPVGEVYCKTVSFFSETVFKTQRARLRLSHEGFFLCFVCTAQKRPSVQLSHMEFSKGLKHKKNIP